jgi:hypothetical protein
VIKAGRLGEPEFGWVIEHDDSPGYAPMYFTLNEGSVGWSLDNLAALRFSREQDAIAFRTVFLTGQGRVQQHGWG